MKRRSNTKRPHDPHKLYLDEGISGPRLDSLLKGAGLFVFQYQTLLPKNKKIPDSEVLARACESGFVLVTKDERMESEWVEDIVSLKARVILLTDQDGGVAHWAAALICAEAKWERVLLDNPIGPLVLKVNRNGTISKITGETELRKRRDRHLTAKIVRAKRLGAIAPEGTYGKEKD